MVVACGAVVDEEPAVGRVVGVEGDPEEPALVLIVDLGSDVEERRGPDGPIAFDDPNPSPLFDDEDAVVTTGGATSPTGWLSPEAKTSRSRSGRGGGTIGSSFSARDRKDAISSRRTYASGQKRSLVGGLQPLVTSAVPNRSMSSSKIDVSSSVKRLLPAPTS